MERNQKRNGVEWHVPTLHSGIIKKLKFNIDMIIKTRINDLTKEIVIDETATRLP